MKEVFDKYSRRDQIILFCFGIFVSLILVQSQCCFVHINEFFASIVKVTKYIFCVIFFIDFFIDIFAKKRKLNLPIWFFSIVSVLSFIPNQSMVFIVLALVLIEMGK